MKREVSLRKKSISYDIDLINEKKYYKIRWRRKRIDDRWWCFYKIFQIYYNNSINIILVNQI